MGIKLNVNYLMGHSLLLDSLPATAFLIISKRFTNELMSESSLFLGSCVASCVFLNCKPPFRISSIRFPLKVPVVDDCILNTFDIGSADNLKVGGGAGGAGGTGGGRFKGAGSGGGGGAFVPLEPEVFKLTKNSAGGGGNLLINILNSDERLEGEGEDEVFKPLNFKLEAVDTMGLGGGGAGR